MSRALRARRWIPVAALAAAAALAAGIVTALAAPSAPTLLSPADNAVLSDARPTLSWTPGGGGDEVSAWRVEIDPGEPGEVVSPLLDPDVTQWAPEEDLAQGAHTWQVLAVDESAAETPSATRAFTVDTIAPGIPTVGAVTSPTNDTTPTFAWTTTEGGGTSFWELRAGSTAEGALVQSGSTGGTGATMTALADGAYNFRVRHQDAAGNSSAFSEPTVIVVDTTGPAPPSVSGPPPFTNDDTPAFSWTPTESGGTFQWQLLAGEELKRAGTTDATSVEISDPAVPDGSYSFRVRHVDELGNAGDFSSPVNFTIDTIPPSISGATSPASPNGLNGWFTSNVQVTFTCNALGGSPIASCGPNQTLTSDTPGQTVQGTATDAAGNTAQTTVGPIKIDKSPPPRPEPVFPTGEDVVTNDVRQTLSWDAVSDVGPSGVASYEVVVQRTSNGAIVHQGTTTSSSYTPDEDLPSAELRWYVLAKDNAGNVLPPPPVGDRIVFTVDPNATPAPVITGGPSGPTNVTRPVFSWVGHQDARKYQWRVLRGGTQVAAGEVDHPVSQVQLPQALAQDGSYTFQVRQRRSVGVFGAFAVRAFTLDTVPPAAPVIVTRPPASSVNAEPVFGWTGEPGGTFQWQVLAFDGTPVQGGEGTARSVSLGPLPAGAPYTFRVRQIDAAGNVGPFTPPAAFSIEAPPPPAPPGGATPPQPAPGDQASSSTLATRSAKVRPATANVGRLTPRVGTVVRTLRPTLRWRPGPRGTRLYNVQIFVMEGATLRKVLSAFPRTNSYRVPAKRLKYGERYVWRPWPYLRTGRFTKAAIGTSFFDVERPRVSPQRARLLAPSAAATKARRAFAVRWRAKAGTPVYRVTVQRGKTTTFSRVVRGTRVRVPARAVRMAGSYRIAVREGRSPASPVWAARPIPVRR